MQSFGNEPTPQLQRIHDALVSIRAPLSLAEVDLHALVAQTLASNGIDCLHEAKVAPRCRIDFLAGDVGIEVKRGKQSRDALLRQLKRYAASPMISAVYVVTERAISLPDVISGKMCRVVPLWALWGVAMPDRTTPLERTESPHLAKGKHVELDVIPLPAAPESVVLPSYLDPPRATQHAYGTLSYNRQRKCWMIRGEPAVTELAKRLFPGSDKGKRGLAYFTAHRRAVGDLNWLMQRYPLDIAPNDRDRWEKAMAQARAYAYHREMLHGEMPEVALPEGAFVGTLRPFQQQGLSWLYHTQRALLADEMGLGKTVQCLACLAAMGAFPCVIVVPPHLMRNWQVEIARFVRINGAQARVHTLQGLKPYPLPEADIYIVHYLLLRGWKEALPRYAFRAVVFDEIQELRHRGTEKYSAASLLSDASDRVFGLSGTPIYNMGGEIWNVVNILDYQFLGDWESFTREWCYGYGNAIVIKPDLLGEHLRREGLMLRRTKQDVLPELPPKRRLVQEVDTDSQLYRQLMEPVMDQLRRWREETMSPPERALLEGSISQGERQATGIAKALFVCQFVRALVEGGERVLLFAHHHAVMDIFRRDLHRLSPVFITGRETTDRKQQSVERFMDGATDLCCVSLRAASGLNLQRATCVVFGELDWSPAVHSQAEDRAHRIGQPDSLLCYYLVSPQGSDADVQEALGLKVSQFLGLMGEAPPSVAEEVQSATIARRHVERLLARSQSESLI
ncbi:MAG: DEAD/DEAH box helicase [Clostridiales bacterium]|nr:DEAD/DEAH box helicase [Clostridiales bacterium]